MTERREAPGLTTATSSSLLQGLRDPGNETVWQRYVDRYRPMIVGYAKRAGLAPADADDVAQQSLLAFSTALREGRYDRAKGRLRAWLFGIVHRQLLNFRRRRGSAEAQPAQTADREDTGLLYRVEAREEMEQMWEEEWRKAVLRQCLAEIRREVEPATVHAFELFAVQGLPADRVGAELGLTANAVYGAKRRILRRIRELLPLMEDVW